MDCAVVQDPSFPRAARTRRSYVHIHRTVYRDDHELLRASARRFFERICVPRQAQWDADSQVDRDTWLAAGREGLLCLTVPTEYGGGGGDFGHTAVIAEEMQHAGLSGWSLSVHSDIVAPYIVRLGTAEQKERWLPKICSGECVLAVAMTEPGTGSDLKAIRTTATRDGDDFIINGSKTCDRLNGSRWFFERIYEVIPFALSPSKGSVTTRQQAKNPSTSSGRTQSYAHPVR
jgi:alkylation response protein AidB-like acyl-CoA dehydrogenase